MYDWGPFLRGNFGYYLPLLSQRRVCPKYRPAAHACNNRLKNPTPARPQLFKTVSWISVPHITAEISRFHFLENQVRSQLAGGYFFYAGVPNDADAQGCRANYAQTILLIDGVVKELNILKSCYGNIFAISKRPNKICGMQIKISRRGFRKYTQTMKHFFSYRYRKLFFS